MENPITRAEHEEFRRRLEEENKRQDARIGILEDSVRQIGALATSVEKLAVSMQSMLKEQEKQGNPCQPDHCAGNLGKRLGNIGACHQG